MAKKELQQTKSYFKMVGKATRLDKDNAFEEKINVKEGKYNGFASRSLRLGVNTSNENSMTVSMFSYEPTEVFLWNSKKKLDNPDYKGDRIPYETWLDKSEELRKQGYAVLETSVGFDYVQNEKKELVLVRKGLPAYHSAMEIYDNIQNGDSIVVEGEIRYSTYNDKPQQNYSIKKLYKLRKDVDFEDEKFQEVSYFEQEMVFVDIDIDKRQGVAYVSGRVINYNKTYENVQFTIQINGEDGLEDLELTKLANMFKKNLKFGDVIKVFGDTVNRMKIENSFADFGGRSKPSYGQGSVSYVKEMNILGIDDWQKGVYKEEDFNKEEGFKEAKQEVKNEFSDVFGGKKKTNEEENPFSLEDFDFLND